MFASFTYIFYFGLKLLSLKNTEIQVLGMELKILKCQKGKNYSNRSDFRSYFVKTLHGEHFVGYQSLSVYR